MRFYFIAALASVGVAAAQSSCPTITQTERCSTCAVPFCIPEITVSNPCGCPTAVPTTTKTETCGQPSACAGGCVFTDYIIEQATSCAPTTGTSTSTSTGNAIRSPTPTGPCPTITDTTWVQNCARAKRNCLAVRCIEEFDVTVPCGCSGSLSTETATSTFCGCKCGSITSFDYEPCPTTPP